MKFPKQLKPTATETVELPSGRSVEIAKTVPVFKLWSGRPVDHTYGGKAVLSFYGKPQFAELGILRIFERDGWKGVWVDTYSEEFRTRYWPGDSIALPKDKELLLNSIYKSAGSEYGCFDVFCWKDGNYIFAEAKRRGKDRMRETQRRWLQAAVKVGVPMESLLIVEWDF